MCCLRRALSVTARVRDQAATSLDARVEHPPAARIGGCRLIPKRYVAPINFAEVDETATECYTTALTLPPLWRLGFLLSDGYQKERCN